MLCIAMASSIVRSLLAFMLRLLWVLPDTGIVDGAETGSLLKSYQVSQYTKLNCRTGAQRMLEFSFTSMNWTIAQ